MARPPACPPALPADREILRDPFPRALIDHAALRHNLAQARHAAPHSRVWAVLKANAYGHGLVEVARTLAAADGLAVARLGEAECLRAAGIRQPLLVLDAPLDADGFRRAAALELELMLYQDDHVRLLEQTPLPRPLSLWLKLDTGMHRRGFPLGRLAALRARLAGCAGLAGAPGLMTHLARADDLMDPFTELQCQRLRDLPEARGLSLSIANSAGLLGWTTAHGDWVRPGIMLYGVSPFLGETAAARDLRPVMTLQARLLAINHCPREETVGYGGAYRCPEDMPVGVVGIGYGDGYPRHAPTGTPVLLGERRVPLIGRVSMDLITLDLRGAPEARVGDRVTLWGMGLPVEEIAQAAGTIAYDLLTGVSHRVRACHLDAGSGP